MAQKRGIGRLLWAIAEGYIPAWSNGPDPEMTSHEGLCLLNTGPADARVCLTIYYTDREPVAPYLIQAPAGRSTHVRLNALREPEPIALGTEYGMVLESDVPIVVQHTRLDSRQSENALMTTIGYSE